MLVSLPSFFAVVLLSRVQGTILTFEKIDLEDKLGPSLKKLNDPGGVVVVAYVDEGSDNHKLVQKLATNTEFSRIGKKKNKEFDKQLNETRFHYIVFTDLLTKKESLTLVYRNPFQKEFKKEGLELLIDGKDVVFSSKPGAVWDEKKVRKWMLKNMYPVINTRYLGKNLSEVDSLIEKKYIEHNPGGLAMVVSQFDAKKLSEYQIVKMLRPHAEKYRGKINFVMVQINKKDPKIMKWLQMFGIGLTSANAEMILIPDLHEHKKGDSDWLRSHEKYHTKHRLSGFTPESVDVFFDSYAQGTLPRYFVTREEWWWKKKKPPTEDAVRLLGPTLDKFCLDEDPKRGRLVMFLNELEGDCENCKKARDVWEKTAQVVKGERSKGTKLVLASLDQSGNEHGEDLIPRKLGAPLVAWYPPGSRETRLKKKRVLTEMSNLLERSKLYVEDILDSIENLILDEQDGEKEEEEL